MVEHQKFDVLVAGGGVGGIMAAYRAQQTGARVLLLGGGGAASSRISSMSSALRYAPADTPVGLFDDMFRAGGYLNDPAVVAAMATRIGPETEHLADLGVPFALDGDRLMRRQPAGTTWPRAVFSMGMLGVDISRALLAAIEASTQPPVTHLGGAVLVDLITDSGSVIGGLVSSPRDQRWLQVSAGAVILATGGAGQLFGTTTNPRGHLGMGYAMALEAGAELVDMEFISFEPFVSTGAGRLGGNDLPTTVLKEGARILNGRGDEFLEPNTAPTKDVICRAMVREVAEGRGTPSGSVLYDLRDMDPAIVDRYVQIAEALRVRGISSREAMIEVMPAQHFLMGGVKIDAHGATTLPGLYAVGEVAGGAHGAHRLAGGGGMEVVAGGSIAGQSAATYALDRVPRAIDEVSARPELLSSSATAPSKEQIGRIRAALDSGLGIMREHKGLASAVTAIDAVRAEVAVHEEAAFVRRSALVASAIARSALQRTESRGDHFRVDFPQRDDLAWFGNQTLRLMPDGDLSVTAPSEPSPDATPVVRDTATASHAPRSARRCIHPQRR